MPGIQKVTDPAKRVTDPVLLSALAKQGVDRDYVEFFQDYSPAHPEAKLYRDLKSNKQFAVISALPRVANGKKITAQWKRSSGGTYHADNNAFLASVDGKRVNVGVNGKTASWSPQVSLNGSEVVCNPQPTLLGVDPTNENYFNNVLEWDYGFCKRRLRLIEGAILEAYVLDHHPDYKEGMVVRGGCNKCGKCDFGCPYQNPDGTCSVYDKRLEMGLLDCIKYPDVDDLLANTAPPECSYWIEYQGEKFQPRDVELVIKSNMTGGIKFNRPYCTEGVLQVVGDEKRFSFNWRINGKPRVWHYPLIIDDSLTVYSATSDGCVTLSMLKTEGWDAIHGATDGGYVDDTSLWRTYAITSWYNARILNYQIDRSFFYFDTSPLGAGVTISAASLSIYIKAVVGAGGNICAQKGTQADPLTTADYDSFTGSYYGSVALVFSQYDVITFNAQGIADINKTGTTKICVREYDHDYLDVGINTSSWGACCYYAEQGNGYKPKLVVTYTTVVAPTVTTQAATNVEATTATGHGNITDTGGENCDKRGIVYDTSSHGDPGNVSPVASDYANYEEETDSFGTGAFTRSLTGLPTGDTIYARAYAHNSAGYSYSAQVEFDTLSIVAPTVTTQAVSDIGTTTATGNGNITDTGGENCSKRGVCWNTTGNPTIADDKSEETDSFGTGAFTRPMTGLTPGEHYYVKAYAYNSEGYGYGAQVEFTTKAYYATGYIGDVIDCTDLVKTYDRLEWTEEIPGPEQAIEIKIRSSPDLSTWTDWEVIYSSPCTSFTTPVQRYLEWVATLTTEQGDTPKLEDFGFFWTKKVE